MTLNLGKRKAGSLTAASPGDTLYIPLSFYNDSGASISIGSTLAVTDIEVFKNGSVTQRATDSGYALLGDTGNFDSRIGFKGISISLFNTADDASFYASGSTYWVAIDSVTVDARTVRFWAAVFEIGGVDVGSFMSDTGSVRKLIRVMDKTDTGGGDTGSINRFARFVSKLDTGGDIVGITATVDTGSIVNGVWNAQTAQHTTDSTFGTLLTDIDTGIRDRLDELDTGMRSWAASDTGVRALLGFLDTGVRNAISQISATVDTGQVNNAVWNGVRSDHTTDGTFGVAVSDIDTGIRTAIGQISATLDTGVVNQAVWQGDASRTLTALDVDTGLRALITASKNELDTGIKDVLADYDTGIRAILALQDTGKVATAVWAGDTGLRDLIADSKNELDTGIKSVLADLDTGLRDKLQTDTGKWLKVNIHKVNSYTVTGSGDTGTADTWRPA